MPDLSAAAQGFLLALGLFICPGPKDVLVFREALLGRSRAVLVAIGSGSDLVLIAVGVLGVSAALKAFPALQVLLQAAGVVLLVGHAVHAARAASRGSADAPVLAARAGDGSWVRRLLVMSLGNPASWLDTVVILGSVGAALPASACVTFSAGAVCASIVWFTAWVSLARGASHWLASPRSWRIVDAVTAIAMLGMALWLAADLVAGL
ncbi:lysine transporter LysE [Paracidovorax avenae]|uniref:LysE/ArgO family amino acid transporter n=1 Tax=Paracidovorax avenae TaxID=80867 RepID=UPI000D177286|nr:LysE family transporter [Paracidovorax avenae]AVS81087.1 lysine transporter LysE [Paracidovorax avenae]AVT16278.1 lysine transporter LysE [Paracidovorax avenae]AVT20298.1 lysine transporter LysE [Paracidovorax avenae]